MQKPDHFGPKRRTSIDGFFVKPEKPRPRQPIFRNRPVEPGSKQSPIMQDMPRRNAQTHVLGGDVRPQNPIYQFGQEPRKSLQQQPEAEPHRRRFGRHKKDKKPQSRRRKIVKRTASLIGIIVLVFAAWFGWKFYRDIANLTGNNNPFSLFGVFHPAHLKNQDGRVNILVAGNSDDQAGHGGAALTDSIMILSVNTRNNTAFMMSVPRDLWVDIPGNGYSKINQAYVDGGMNLLQQVIQDKLNMTIDYQALVNWTAFRDLVNAVGGITINIHSQDPRGIYDPSIDLQTHQPLVKLSNGEHTLDGQQALNLARARGDSYYSYGYAGSDFTRTEYQREMLVAIKNKASQSNVIANPFKVTKLIDAVGNNVRTDLSIGEIETLYSYMKKVNNNNIQSYNVNSLAGKDKTLLKNYTAPDGEDALIPAAGIDDYSQIQKYVKRLFAGNTNNAASQEGAAIVLLNATNSMHVASGQESVLTGKGLNVVLISDAPQVQPNVTIVDNSNGQMPQTLALLKKQYDANVVQNTTLTSDYPGADFIVLLGEQVVASR